MLSLPPLRIEPKREDIVAARNRRQRHPKQQPGKSVLDLGANSKVYGGRHEFEGFRTSRAVGPSAEAVRCYDS